jgi:hypothetical protein
MACLFWDAYGCAEEGPSPAQPPFHFTTGPHRVLAPGTGAPILSIGRGAGAPVDSARLSCYSVDVAGSTPRGALWWGFACRSLTGLIEAAPVASRIPVRRPIPEPGRCPLARRSEGHVDAQGFRAKLQSLGMEEGEIRAAISLARRFEAYVAAQAAGPSAASAWGFSRTLIEEGRNTRANYVALIHYCRFIGDHEMFVALLELVDGAEVGQNLFNRMADAFGPDLRDEVFSGMGIPPYGTPSPDKPGFLHPIVHRLRERVGEQACNEFLSACMRDLPQKDFLPEREAFRKAGSIDEYLRLRREGFLAQLEECLRQGRPFFAQQITQEVIDFVRSQPEMGGGRREGNVIYETKIPYMTDQYLAETDPVLKRYHACHCPWARDAIKHGGVKLAETFCYCSGGFHKKPWEAIFGQPLRVQVLESALRGDLRCRFAIHLPLEAAAGNASE